MRRDIFIGDVHGCVDELDALLTALSPQPADRLFFLGDLVDRGPSSIGAVRRVRALIAAFPGSCAIAGNHEEKALRLRERDLAGRETRRLEPWAEEAEDRDWRFLDTLPLICRLPERGVIMVHGGLYPRYFEMHGELGEVGPGWRRERGKRADRLRRMLRTRRIDGTGNVAALGEETLADPHWSQLYDGREGFCFFGHDPQLGPPLPLRALHATGLDTGCCFGGRLTAAVLPEGAAPAEATFVSVPAVIQYAEPRKRYEE